MPIAKTSLLTPALRWFLFAMILANISGGMVFTVLPIYLAELGASVAQVGFVFSAAALVPLMLQVFGGWLSDSIGRLRTVAIGSAAATFGYLGFVIAPSWEWVILALGLEYVSGSLVAPSFGAFIADQSSEAQRGRVFGLANSLFMVVGVVGPPLGGWLADWLGFRAMMLAAFILYFMASLLRIWMAKAQRFRETRPVEKPSLAGFRSSLGAVLAMLAAGGVVTWIMITDGVSDIAWRLSDDLQPLYTSRIIGLSITQIGLLHSGLAAAMMVVTAPAGWLADRFSERFVIITGLLLQAVSMFLFVIVDEFYSFLWVAVVLGIGIGVLIPAYDSLVSKAVPENLRGTAYGFFRSSLGVISLPAPWLGAQLWEWFGARIPFLLTGIGALIAILPVWFKFRLPGLAEVITVEPASDECNRLKES